MELQDEAQAKQEREEERGGREAKSEESTTILEPLPEMPKRVSMSCTDPQSVTSHN